MSSLLRMMVEPNRCDCVLVPIVVFSGLRVTADKFFFSLVLGHCFVDVLHAASRHNFFLLCKCLCKSCINKRYRYFRTACFLAIIALSFLIPSFIASQSGTHET